MTLFPLWRPLKVDIYDSTISTDNFHTKCINEQRSYNFNFSIFLWSYLYFSNMWKCSFWVFCWRCKIMKLFPRWWPLKVDILPKYNLNIWLSHKVHQWSILVLFCCGVICFLKYVEVLILSVLPRLQKMFFIWSKLWSYSFSWHYLEVLVLIYFQNIGRYLFQIISKSVEVLVPQQKMRLHFLLLKLVQVENWKWSKV